MKRKRRRKRIEKKKRKRENGRNNLAWRKEREEKDDRWKKIEKKQKIIG